MSRPNRPLPFARLLRLAAGLAMLCYPFLVLAYIESDPTIVVVLLAFLGSARVVLAGRLGRGSLLSLVGLATFCVIAWWVNAHFQMVKLYPVLVSTAGAAYALWTIARPPSAAERFAKTWEPSEQFDERKRTYMRHVTAVWAVFFIGNGAIAAYTAVWTSIGVWAIYNGIVSYMLVGTLLCGEYLFRIWYRRRHYPRIG